MVERLNRAEKKELMKQLGHPARSSFHRWLDNPGSMKVDTATVFVTFLSEIHDDVSFERLAQTRIPA